MKQISYFIITAVVVCAMITGCSKKGNVTPSTDTLPAPVSNIITAAIIDSLQKHGAVINKGTTPPVISGIFLIHPLLCTFDDSPGNFGGQTFDDYKYKFSEQNNSKFSIRVDYLDVHTPGIVLTDINAAYVSGNGNFFTVYSRFNAVKNGVNFVIIHVISGEVATGGIKNFQNSTYIVSKDADPNHYVEPQGAIRVFRDNDFFSEVQDTFNFM